MLTWLLVKWPRKQRALQALEVEQNGPSGVTQPEAGFCATYRQAPLPRFLLPPCGPWLASWTLVSFVPDNDNTISTRYLLQGLPLLSWLPYFLPGMELHCLSGLMGDKGEAAGKDCPGPVETLTIRDLSQMLCSVRVTWLCGWVTVHLVVSPHVTSPGLTSRVTGGMQWAGWSHS